MAKRKTAQNGRLDNQLFVVLVSSSRELKMGFFGNSVTKPPARSRRRSTAILQESHVKDNIIFAVAGYSTGGSADVGTENAGQKRKASTLDVPVDTFGDITLTTLSVDRKKLNTIVFSKYTIKLSSSEGTDKGAVAVNGHSQYQGISGEYTKE
jgi:hypothetical protein